MLAVGLLVGSICRGQTLTGRDALMPLDPPPVAGALSPGLEVLYFYGKFRHIDKMPTGSEALRAGKPGKPILRLDHDFGEEPVFDSGVNRAVGLQMTGVIHLTAFGTYIFQAKSNDGIRVSIGPRIVADDPTVHADRFSEPVSLAIERPGWYPIQVLYFQRKGTAAIDLQWQRPGEATFESVPPAALAHLPGAR
jgi:hypothetical protein